MADERDPWCAREVHLWDVIAEDATPEAHSSCNCGMRLWNDELTRIRTGETSRPNPSYIASAASVPPEPPTLRLTFELNQAMGLLGLASSIIEGADKDSQSDIWRIAARAFNEKLEALRAARSASGEDRHG